jgi:UDP:flavonoid glycosyltransferase YjiC (YdhE family)
MNKRILFATYGSLGDLHPYIAIAIALKQRGHAPVIASFSAYRAAVEAEGIAFAALRPDIEQFGGVADVARRLFTGRDGPRHIMQHLFMPHIRDSYEDLDRAAADCDLIVTHPLSFAGPLVAQKRSLPWVSSILSPLSLLSCMDPPLLNEAPWLRAVRKLGVGPYRAVFSLAKLATRHWESPLQELRASLGLPPAPPAMFEGQYSPLLNLTLFSPLLATPQADWPANTVLCGFPRYDGKPADDATIARLRHFLAGGDPPLVFGLGSSAVLIAGDFWHHAIAAAHALGRRAVLLTGESPQLPQPVPSTVAVFDYLPYSAV